MNGGKRFQGFIIAMIITLATIFLVGGITLAWFTFSQNTNVTPTEGRITEGASSVSVETIIIKNPDGMNLSISNQYDGEYSTECELKLLSTGGLKPVSTANLQNFYSAVGLTTDGVASYYEDVTAQMEQSLMHGKVYLKVTVTGAEIYFDKNNMSCDGYTQILSSARLGLNVTSGGQTKTYIFNLDAMPQEGSVTNVRTVPEAGKVVASIDNANKAIYVDDPAESIADYYSGGKSLCTMKADEIATIEYWLYLEGCDDSCNNAVHNMETGLKFGFTGVSDGTNQETQVVSSAPAND